jgi:murein DD-endopeptidase MepM/ murein hydrolase activator NlpD
VSSRRRTLISCALLLVGAATAIALYLWSRHWDDRSIAWPREVPPCDGFDFPVEAIGFHDMLAFGERDTKGLHLGNDWTGDGDDNADLGAPVFATAAGVVIDARDIGGDWGNVVRIAHGCGVESVYAHLEAITAHAGATVKRGDKIGTIGNADGEYTDAHLHFELRDRPLPLGGGYYDEGEDITGYLDPTAYIRAHRPSQQ